MVSSIACSPGVAALNDSLESWKDIKHHFQDGGILLGNGFSQAVWHKFGYGSIYETACLADRIAHPLSAKDTKVFNSIGTSNFELVLSRLSTTIDTTDIFDRDVSPFEESYERIKTALGEAIQYVHVPREMMSLETLGTIREELRRYRYVYSTNYDLLPYWSIMSTPSSHEFKDFFWGHDSARNLTFDMTNTSIWGTSTTRVYYLHGALHLYRNPRTGRTHKLTNQEYGNLLDIVELPLFITEGTAEDKQRAIRQSDYLSFAYQSFLQHQGPLVIFGHSLDASDEHLIRAIRQNTSGKIAISIRGSNSSDSIMARKATLQKALCDNRKYYERPELLFFDSSTHPLGAPSIRVADEPVTPAWPRSVDFGDVPF